MACDAQGSTSDTFVASAASFPAEQLPSVPRPHHLPFSFFCFGITPSSHLFLFPSSSLAAGAPFSGEEGKIPRLEMPLGSSRLMVGWSWGPRVENLSESQVSSSINQESWLIHLC